MALIEIAQQQFEGVSGWLGQMGIMGIPLMVSSIIMVALVLERMVAFVLLPGLGQRSMNRLLSSIQTARDENRLPELAETMQSKRGLGRGISCLLAQAHRPKALREEVGGLWLLSQRRKLNSGLRLLMVLGILTPMMGLLGTVLGMIEMFKDISTINGPVTPALLAAGLRQAMYTTAAGLLIAIPALSAAHLMGLWASHYMGRLEFALNHVNLLLEGVRPEAVSGRGKVVFLQREEAA